MLCLQTSGSGDLLIDQTRWEGQVLVGDLSGDGEVARCGERQWESGIHIGGEGERDKKE